MKNVWITALHKDTATVGTVMSSLGKYGLDCNGAFWNDDLDGIAWLDQSEQLSDPTTALWIILGTDEQCDKASVAYGLSLLMLYVRSKRKAHLPVLWITPGEKVMADALPTLFQAVDQYRLADASYPVKAVAKANMPPLAAASDTRIGIHAHKAIGVWFEVGPASGIQWNGAMFGTDTGEIDFHAVGVAGQLPEKSIVEYPRKGLRLESGADTYTTWAVQNHLDDTLSYFVRVRGIPSRILIGPYSSDNDAEVSILRLS